MKIYTADSETGTFIEECGSIEEARKTIVQYEKEDKINNCYEDDFYCIVNEHHETIE